MTQVIETGAIQKLGCGSYSPSIVTMALSCIVCEIQRLIGRKSRNFYSPPVFSAPAWSDPVRILWRCLMLIKLKWLGYRIMKTSYDNTLSHFHTIPECNGQTDKDRFAILISRVSKYRSTLVSQSYERIASGPFFYEPRCIKHKVSWGKHVQNLMGTYSPATVWYTPMGVYTKSL